MKVLVVDDTIENHDLVKQCLGKAGIETIHALAGTEAIQLFEKEADIVALIVDVEMPEMNGFEFAERFHDTFRNNEIPLLFISAYRIEETDMFRGYRLGAFEYITRPFYCKVLQSKVKLYAQLYTSRKQLVEQNQDLLAVRNRLIKKLQKTSNFNLEILDSKMKYEERVEIQQQKIEHLEKLVEVYMDEIDSLIQKTQT